MIWEVEVPGKRPPRPGEVHWAKLQREKRRWEEYLGFLALRDKVPRCAPGERRQVDIVFYRPGPVGDKDNTHAACKIPLDALVRRGLIEDDSPKCIELHATSVSARRSRTVIRLSHLPA